MWTHQGNNGKAKAETSVMASLGACMNKVVTDGYSECFKLTTRGLYSTSLSRFYRPEQVHLIKAIQFEGSGDTAGNKPKVYMLETSDGLKGTLVDDTGVYPDGSVAHFVAEAEDIRRRMGPHNQNFC